MGGGVRKGSRWLEDKLVCAAPANKAKGQDQATRPAKERDETHRDKIAQEECKREEEEGEESHEERRWEREKLVEESGCSRRVWGSLAVWGVWALWLVESGCSFQLQFPQSNCPLPVGPRGLLGYWNKKRLPTY